jgi:hypothetical protein
MRSFLFFFLIFFVSAVYAVPTAITSVTLSPAGPYYGGQSIMVTVVIDASNSSSFQVNLRVQDATSATCWSTPFNVTFPASVTSATFAFTMPTGNFTSSGTGCSSTSVSGSSRFIRAFIGKDAFATGSPASGFGNVSTSFVLPVTLSNFATKIFKKSIEINWSTASETNNDYFTIERSSDGRDFRAIGTVDGAGNSTETLDYSYVDESPLSGTSYYRLKQTDYDGKYSYSDVRAVKIDSDADAYITYNAYTQEIISNASDEAYDIRIVDMTGRVVKNLNSLSDVAFTNVSDLNNGTYVAIMRSESTNKTLKFIKQ